MSDKFYIVPEIVLDMLQENFKHSHFKPAEQNKINKGKVDVLDLLKTQVHSVCESDIKEITNNVSFGIRNSLRENFFTMPGEIYVTIEGSLEICRNLFLFFKQNNYSGNFDKLLEEAIFLVNLKDKTAKSFANTKEPIYNLEHFKIINKFFNND